MPTVFASDARRPGESDINYNTRVSHAKADRELGPYPQKLTESQMREIGDRARKIFKDEMGMTYTKENNNILQELHQRLEKEELERLQAEYLQKRKQVVGGIKRRKTRASKKSKKRNTRRTRK